jgi:YcaO-like protein with predicted kinase domain
VCGDKVCGPWLSPTRYDGSSQIAPLTAQEIDAILAVTPGLTASQDPDLLNPFRTVNDLRRLAVQIGVTRLGNASNLDRIAAYNFYAIRPAARHPDAIYSSGKGFFPFEAQTKAVFESYERWAAEVPAQHFEGVPAVVFDAAAHAGAVVYLSRELSPYIPVRWAVGRRLFDSAVAVAPEHMIAFPASGSACPSISTTGLAGHISQALAIEAAILERLERHATAALSSSSLQRITTDALSYPARRLLNSMSAEDIECAVFRLEYGARIPVEVCYAFAFDHYLGIPQSHCSGFGAALTLTDSAEKALLEVTQSRAAFITGMRDDVAGQVSVNSIDIERLRRQRSWLDSLRAVRTVARTTDPTGSFLEIIGRAVRGGDLNEPAVFPLREAQGAKAVRVLIPDLLEAL